MRRTVLLLVLCIIGLRAIAQENTGREQVGINLNYYYTNTKTEVPNGSSVLSTSQTSLQMLPYYGVFINNNTLLGAGLSYYFENEKVRNQSGDTEYTCVGLYSVNLLIRRYH